MSGTLSFFTGMAGNLLNTDLDGMNAAMQDYLTKIDIWLEGYRQGVEMTTLDDGTSAMEIAYRLPPAAVKSQLKQLIVDLMNDELFLKRLTAVMPPNRRTCTWIPSCSRTTSMRSTGCLLRAT